MSEDRPYEGKELELFAHARNWKRYWSGKIKPHLGKAVLEVGAGLGTNTPYLLGPGQGSWLCLEPDGALTEQIPATLATHPQRDIVRTRTGMLRDLAPDERFDTILYIDVLEHIEDDLGEMRQALAHLSDGGKIIVLSPAQPGLYTEFDRALGHYRRYTPRDAPRLHTARREAGGNLRARFIRPHGLGGEQAAAAPEHADGEADRALGWLARAGLAYHRSGDRILVGQKPGRHLGKSLGLIGPR